MSLVAKLLISILALVHIYFLYIEMFCWTKPKTLKSFRMTEEVAQSSKKLAANQGLYNGFLAAGLIWSTILSEPFGKQLAIFFCACVTIAGIYGAISVTRKIFYVQALPALLALVACLVG